jgi:hypothetical protein
LGRGGWREEQETAELLTVSLMHLRVHWNLALLKSWYLSKWAPYLVGFWLILLHRFKTIGQSCMKIKILTYQQQNIDIKQLLILFWEFDV